MRDIIMAQHEANLYSHALREQYGRNGKVKDFQLPGAVLGDIEMELCYGVIDTSNSNEQSAFRFEKFNNFMRDVATKATAKTIAVISDYVLTNGLQTPEGGKFFDRLKKQPETYQEYSDYIRGTILSAVGGSAYEMIDKRTGSPDEEAIVSRIGDSISNDILGDIEATKTLFNDPDGNARKAMAQRIITELTALVAKLSKNKRFKRTKSFPMLNVAVTADELNTLPRECIHTCRLKFTPTTCNIRCDEDDVSLPPQSIEDIIK